MAVPAAYLGVILIWTTTPLAIQWSGDGPGYLFGVTGRLVLSALLSLALVRLLHLPMPWTRRARKCYLASGLGIYGSMLLVYWSAQFVPSGWIAVMFGLSPIITGIIASRWLAESPLTLARSLGAGLGFAGLLVVFGEGTQGDPSVLYGIAALCIAVLIHSASAVWLKTIGLSLHGLVLTTGGLLVAVPLFLLTWFVSGESWPRDIDTQAAASIIYLALIGSVLGFALYYYLLHRMDVMRLALITLITPISALLLGALLNGEIITPLVWLGSGLILLGLACFELGERIIPSLSEVEKE